MNGKSDTGFVACEQQICYPVCTDPPKSNLYPLLFNSAQACVWKLLVAISTHTHARYRLVETILKLIHGEDYTNISQV